MEGEEYEYPLKPEQKTPKWRDPDREWFYYKALVMGTVEKGITIYGLIAHPDIAVFVILSLVILVIDTLATYPFLFYGVWYIKKYQKGPGVFVVRICDVAEYLQSVLYAGVAILCRSITGENSLYDEIQLCLTAFSLGLKLWKFCVNLIESWTDNSCILISNKVFFFMLVYVVIQDGSMVAFGVFQGLFNQLFIWFGLAGMYIIYAIILIVFEQWCCPFCCFSNNHGKCCCPSDSKLVNNPKRKKKENYSSAISLLPSTNSPSSSSILTAPPTQAIPMGYSQNSNTSPPTQAIPMGYSQNSNPNPTFYPTAIPLPNNSQLPMAIPISNYYSQQQFPMQSNIQGLPTAIPISSNPQYPTFLQQQYPPSNNQLPPTFPNPTLPNQDPSNPTLVPGSNLLATPKSDYEDAYENQIEGQ